MSCAVWCSRSICSVSVFVLDLGSVDVGVGFGLGIVPRIVIWIVLGIDIGVGISVGIGIGFSIGICIDIGVCIRYRCFMSLQRFISSIPLVLLDVGMVLGIDSVVGTVPRIVVETAVMIVLGIKIEI